MTKGQVEELIKKSFIKIHKKIIGKGPQNLNVVIVKNYVIIETYGVLTNLDKQLLILQNGKAEVLKLRNNILAVAQEQYNIVLEEILRTKVENAFAKYIIEKDKKYSLFICKDDIEEKILLNNKASKI